MDIQSDSILEYRTAKKETMKNHIYIYIYNSCWKCARFLMRIWKVIKATWRRHSVHVIPSDKIGFALSRWKVEKSFWCNVKRFNTFSFDIEWSFYFNQFQLYIHINAFNWILWNKVISIMLTKKWKMFFLFGTVIKFNPYHKLVDGRRNYFVFFRGE